MTARKDDADVRVGKDAAAAAAREAKGSVQEAIGKLIGDDAARQRGTAEKEAGAADASDIKKSSRA
jgi:uncharacterized protein YjbJ (UPF0337 family)